MNKIITRFRRLVYYHQHVVVAGLISLAAWLVFPLIEPSLPSWLAWIDRVDALLAGAVFYAIRELNQFAAGRLGYSWPVWLDWLLGRPNPKFDGLGFRWPVIVWSAIWAAARFAF